jgi:hypothetical protein
VGDNGTSPDALKDALNKKLQHLSGTERAEPIPVMTEYHDLFRYDRSGMLPCTDKGFHEIKTGDAVPIKKNLYTVPFALKDEMQKQLDDMWQRGVITPACSEWAAPVILVKKKSLDGTQNTDFAPTFGVECGNQNSCLPHSRY